MRLTILLSLYDTVIRVGDMFDFSCTVCRDVFHSDEQHIGRVIECPRCGTKVLVPSPIESSSRDNNAAASSAWSNPKVAVPGAFKRLKGPAMILVFLSFLVSILALAELTWPISPLFLAMISTWWALRTRRDVWSMAGAAMAGPISIGLGVLVVLTFLLNQFRDRNAAEVSTWLRATDVFMVDLGMLLRPMKSFYSLPVFVAIIAAAAVFGRYRPDLKPVTRTLRLKRRLSRLSLVVATITSFTFFGQIEVGRLADKAEAQLVLRYRAALRNKSEADDRSLIAKTIRKDADSARASQVPSHPVSSGLTQRAVSGQTSDYRRPAANRADSRPPDTSGSGGRGAGSVPLPPPSHKGGSSSGNDSMRQPQPEQEAVGRIERIKELLRESGEHTDQSSQPPATLHADSLNGWRAEQVEIQQIEGDTAKVEQQTSEIIEAAKAIFVETVGEAIPGFDRLGETFGSLTNNYLKKVLDGCVKAIPHEVILKRAKDIASWAVSLVSLRRGEDKESLRRASDATGRKQWGKAIKILNSLINEGSSLKGEADDMLARTYYDKAEHEFNTGLYREAAEDYQVVYRDFAQSKNAVNARSKRAVALAEASRPPAPIAKTHDKIDYDDHQSAEELYTKGSESLRLGDLPAAKEYFKRASKEYGDPFYAGLAEQRYKYVLSLCGCKE
jgi:DNA-directed RNA polymerase subunit RPC12/RpoP